MRMLNLVAGSSAALILCVALSCGGDDDASGPIDASAIDGAAGDGAASDGGPPIDGDIDVDATNQATPAEAHCQGYVLFCDAWGTGNNAFASQDECITTISLLEDTACVDTAFSQLVITPTAELCADAAGNGNCEN